jgi:hypothetical protein
MLPEQIAVTMLVVDALTMICHMYARGAGRCHTK